MITMQNGKHLLDVHHIYRADRATVYQAWTVKEQLEQWWGVKGFKTTIERMDVSPGGMYRFAMQAPNGFVHTLEGHYVEIIPNEKLSFTWNWVNEADADETLVTIHFVDKGGQTELILNHANFTTLKAAKRHNNNWKSALENGLSDYVH
ncbi:SRPBCC domain-containing protein [Paenibacillus sp. GCM10012307]|uniref:SRPBCC domain-containing protein n=1 Tax=Paenibacillus roseus TaxID=2798579 RepID=A0A934J453_9BACL|nr:SRPBCC domain-containing protein [Paenibacillus roseus]MBJ6360013.1 SRPBCC domain-containing protein [Paenibacillus roseus]